MIVNCDQCLKGRCEDCSTLDCLCREDHSKNELLKNFTDVAKALLPDVKELKELLRLDADADKTILADEVEFNQKKGGFDVYMEKMQMQYFAKDFVSDIMLPAHTSNGKASCGKPIPKACLESDLHEQSGGFIKRGIMSCNNKGCRLCAVSSIKREALKLTARMVTFCILKANKKVYQNPNRKRELLHIVVSPPFKEQSLFLDNEGRKKLRKKAREILSAFDYDGGAVVDHPYRFTKGLESAYFSPHFHNLGTGWINGDTVKQIYEQTGWIIKVISTIKRERDCYNLSKYLFSHAAVYLQQEGKRSAEHSVRYIGECQNKKFKVESVLKFSRTGLDEIDTIMYQAKEKTIKGIDYPLQKVSYTHSIIEEEIKQVQHTYFEEYINGNVHAFVKSLKRFIQVHKDNPALPQSEPPSMEFLQMRLDYGTSQYDIVQSVYLNIIFNPSLDDLCPDCSLKLLTVVPSDRAKSEIHIEKIGKMLIDLPDDIILPFDDVSLFSYMKDAPVTYLGLPYFDFEGKFHYDTGVYSKPDCLDELSISLYCTITRNIEIQNLRYQYKVNNKKSMPKEELEDLLISVKSRFIAKPLDTFIQ